MKKIMLRLFLFKLIRDYCLTRSHIASFSVLASFSQEMHVEIRFHTL